jgi:hypothetical protein
VAVCSTASVPPTVAGSQPECDSAHELDDNGGSRSCHAETGDRDSNDGELAGPSLVRRLSELPLLALSVGPVLLAVTKVALVILHEQPLLSELVADLLADPRRQLVDGPQDALGGIGLLGLLLLSHPVRLRAVGGLAPRSPCAGY